MAPKILSLPSAPKTQTMLFLLFALLATNLGRAEEPIAFNRDIRPILSEHCFQCHGPDAQQRQGNLRLDQRDAAIAPADSGKTAILPNHSGQSELIARLLTSDTDLHMPPASTGKQLSESQIKRLQLWIDQGAPYEGHWAFIPPTRPNVPLPNLASSYPNPIDRFLLAKLQSHGLDFSQKANKETLIRRLSLDLTGLPPTLEEIDAFLADNSADAYEKVVDRLLASPHYGEQMALPWLDLARYADSNGFQVDSSRQQWPWRDWLIDAFNQNVPFDQFTIEQIAGDMLPNATLQQKVASGFQRNHRLNGEGGIIAEEWRVETVIDRVETTGLTWMALTLNCCRCHDHKYDPISQREFYSLFAYFNNVTESGTLQGESRNTEPVLSVPTSSHREELANLENQLTSATSAVQSAEQNIPQEITPWEIEFKKTIASQTPTWNILAPTSVSAKSGTTLTKQPDGSYLASGPNPNDDIYETVTNPPESSISGILLECFPDPSLPQQSLGRYPNGNFVLTRLEVEVIPPSNPKNTNPNTEPNPNTAPLKLTGKVIQADADYSQKGWEIGNTIAGNPGKGWAVDGPTRKEICRAMFLLETPLQIEEGSQLTIRLVQQTLGQHNIGRFRLATTSLPKGSVAIAGTQIPESLKSLLALPASDRTESQRNELMDYYKKNASGPYQQAVQKVEQTKKQIADLQAKFPTVMVMQEMDKPRDAFILIRGEYDKRGDKVTTTLPKVLPQLREGEPNNRLGLARWIADRNHPLTARVWVNRMWEKFMGNGLVKTTENFGSQAEWPSNPELLDWLALEFMEPTWTAQAAGSDTHAWDMKALQKTMVMSYAYQQNTSLAGKDKLVELDPDNRWLGRGPRFRLSGELLRDQALHISGLLTKQIGGPSVRPYMPDGVWDETSVYGDLRNYQHDKNENLYRRSLYTVWKRTAAPPTMLLFDAPNREICTVKRSRTNTPLQALSLLNEITFVEAARKLGQRMLDHPAPTLEEKLRFGFRLATSRLPSEQELQVLVASWNEDVAYYSEHLEQAEQLRQLGESKSENSHPAQLAAFTLAGNVLLNLDEVITRE
jgi:hypothetical protein